MRPTLLCSALFAGLAMGPAHAAAPPADQAIAELNEFHRHHQHGGITQFVALSLDTLGEDEARRPKVQELEDTLNSCMEPAEELEASVLGLLSAGVAAGTVDAARVKAEVERGTAAAATIHDCVAAPMNQLHATLTKPERAELGDKVRAHWEVWRASNHDAEPWGREPGGRLADLAVDLQLTPDQVEKMAQALKTAFAGHSFDAAVVQKQVEAFAVAFAGEAFDATRVTTGSTASLTAQGLQRMALFYQAVTPLLKPDQRATLSGHLREHANHHPAEASR